MPTVDPPFSPWLICLSLVACLLLWTMHHSRKICQAMPPGPPGIPFLGNIFQLPITLYWQKFEEWKEVYGSIFSLNILGQHIVVISDFSTTARLLSHRSGIYSDRPRLIMANELMCGGRNPAFAPYGDYWRRLRKAGHEGFHTRAVTAYQPMQEEYAARLVSALLSDPANKDAHIRRASASTILSIIYGWPPLDARMDTVVDAINGWVHKTAKEAMPGRRLVESFPWMLHLPEMVAPWKRWGLEQERVDGKMFLGFLEGLEAFDAKERPSWAAKILQDRERLGLGPQDIAWLTGGFFGAGAETSAATLRAFLLAMILHPQCMRRAQHEIDAVVGSSRMPSFADEPNLPYITAIVREVLRWRPVVPMGLPRKVSQDDWFDGYLIPKGTIVIQNVWGMNHDSAVFDNPDNFNPERYLNEDGGLNASIPDTVGLGHATFGAGRRICCGKDLAIQSLFINVVNILWAMDIMPAQGSDRNAILPSAMALVDNGIVVEPAPFECILNLRSTDLTAIIASKLPEVAIHLIE